MFRLGWSCCEWWVIEHFPVPKICTRLLNYALEWKCTTNSFFNFPGFDTVLKQFLSVAKAWWIQNLGSAILASTKMSWFCFPFTSLCIPTIWTLCLLPLAPVWIFYSVYRVVFPCYVNNDKFAFLRLLFLYAMKKNSNSYTVFFSFFVILLWFFALFRLKEALTTCWNKDAYYGMVIFFNMSIFITFLDFHGFRNLWPLM